MGGSQAQRGEWDKAADAFARAVQIADSQPMYQMWYGISLYEKAVKQARDDQARKENKKPEEIQVDLTTVSFDKAEQHLEQAIKENGDLWRAHYYMGRIYRAQDKPKEAATEFSAALAANPRESGPYIALSELYRAWDYTDEAIKVASQGAANVPGANEVSEIWFSLGMGYYDKNDFDKAIEAFDKAIESKRDNHKAKFQRGQAYFKKGDMTHAKRDLEEFSKSGGASLEFAKQQASKMLMDIAAKSMSADKPPEPKMSPEEMVKNKKGKK
jgi:tetratricopeptide (TPR) repeat protein